MSENKFYFISFEGMDGSGKDTQLMRLCEQIREDDNYPFGTKYSPVWITREPTNLTKEGCLISEKIRKGDVSKEEATELYVTDRIQHSRIIESILKYSHVLVSRYDLSTLAYQMTQGMDFEDLYSRHHYGEKNGVLEPDITVVFLLPEETAYQRVSSRDEQKECFEKRSFQQNLESNLNYCIKELEKRGREIITVDASQPIEDVTKEMLDKIHSYIQNN